MADNKKPDEKKIDKKEELNIFILNSIYPDAESIFKFNLESLDKIKDSCYVVLDTNALLVPYTISKDSLEQIKGIYKKLIDTSRLVIPGQVAREFAKNRSQKITELYDHLSKKRDGVKFDNIGTYPLLESFQEYKNLIEVGKQIDELIKGYRKQIAKITDLISGWRWDDPVSLMYRELFSDKVVLDLDLDEPKREETAKDLRLRQLYSIPPGYKDAGKPDNGIGDLIIWHTILHIGETHKKHVCFVSGDAKADWYNKSNNQPLYPRYELVDEFRRCSDGQSFHMINFSRFLNLFGASDSVVEEVKEEESYKHIDINADILTGTWTKKITVADYVQAIKDHIYLRQKDPIIESWERNIIQENTGDVDINYKMVDGAVLKLEYRPVPTGQGVWGTWTELQISLVDPPFHNPYGLIKDMVLFTHNIP